MTNIKIKCVDQVLVIENSPEVASGDILTDTVTFSFCPLWDGLKKIAVFYNDPKKQYQVMLDDNNTAEIPPEVLEDQGVLYIGVLGTVEDKIKTSNVIRYRVNKGAYTKGAIVNPSPSIFEQILIKLNDIETKLAEIQYLTVEEVDQICEGTYAEVLTDENLAPVMDLEEITEEETREILEG